MLGYEKAQQDYDNMQPDSVNVTVCKKCGEYDEKLYGGYCLDCLTESKFDDADIVKEFCSTFNNQFYRIWWNNLSPHVQIRFMIAAFEDSSKNFQNFEFKNFALDRSEDFKDYVKENYNG